MATSGDPWTDGCGIEVLEVGEERVRLRLDVGPRHHQGYGIVHGGVYATIVETAASYGAGFAALAKGQRGIVGIANATDFLRSHVEGPLAAEARPVHVGRQQQLWQVEIRREADAALVARGQVRFQVLAELPSERASNR